MKRWRGLKNLVGEAVDHGSRAVERVQKDMVKLPFDMLEKITPIAVPVKGVREIYETSLSGVHGMIRLVNRVVGDTLDTVIDVVDKQKAGEGDAAIASGEKPAIAGAGKKTVAAATAASEEAAQPSARAARAKEKAKG